MRTGLNLVIFAFLAAVFWLGDHFYGASSLRRGFETFLSLTVLYAVFRGGFLPLGLHKIKNSKTRYTYRKTLSTLMWAVFLLIALRIWVEDPQALIVTYGLVGAGIAIALQDVFKNLAGGLIVVLTRPYTVGDRIEVGEDAGDVINVGVFQTTLLEIRGWIDADQATGRIVQVPNGRLLTEPVRNYTLGHDFIWDEIFIPLEHSSDWKRVRDLAIGIAGTQTAIEAQKATETLSRLRERYYLDARETEPRIYVRMTDNWIDLRLRYVVRARDRREVHSRMSESILLALEAEGIPIASATLDITSLPDIIVKKK